MRDTSGLSFNYSLILLVKIFLVSRFDRSITPFANQIDLLSYVLYFRK